MNFISFIKLQNVGDGLLNGFFQLLFLGFSLLQVLLFSLDLLIEFLGFFDMVRVLSGFGENRNHLVFESFYLQEN